MEVGATGGVLCCNSFLLILFAVEPERRLYDLFHSETRRCAGNSYLPFGVAFRVSTMKSTMCLSPPMVRTIIAPSLSFRLTFRLPMTNISGFWARTTQMQVSLKSSRSATHTILCRTSVAAISTPNTAAFSSRQDSTICAKVAGPLGVSPAEVCLRTGP